MQGYRGQVAAALCALLLLTGCSNTYVARDPAGPFKAAVAAGDEALAGGYVYGAWQWYKASLAADTAVDPDGRIAANLELARRLLLARQQLAKIESPAAAGTLRSPALVLSQYAVAETETIRARDRVLDSLTVVRDALYSEWTDANAGLTARQLRKAGPWTAMVAHTTGREWDSSLRPVPGRLGERLRAAAGSLKEAADRMERASSAADRTVARSLVLQAQRAIERATSEMSAASGTAPTLLESGARYAADPGEFGRLADGRTY